MIAVVAGKNEDPAHQFRRQPETAQRKGTPMMMNSFRTRVAICAAGAALVAALTAGTAIAGADANDDAFNAAMQKAGWPAAKTPDGYTQLGRDICDDMAKGTTQDQIVKTFMDLEAANGDLKAAGINVTDPMVTAMVSAAKQTYCP